MNVMEEQKQILVGILITLQALIIIYFGFIFFLKVIGVGVILSIVRGLIKSLAGAVEKRKPYKK
jgi:5-bromo-4-chloroindolyl phosphate hydrolysis protein